jgi:hypothetical protein
VAMTVVLLDETNGEFCLRRELVDTLARLGVTSVALARDERTVGIVLEGWLFDPARSANAVVEAFGAASRARTLHPVLQLAVVTATDEGG